MRDLDIADTREKLSIYSRVGLLGKQEDGSVQLIESNPRFSGHGL
jgi:argininosuccinate synthase